MADYPPGVDMAAAIAAGFVLDRREAVPQLIGRHEDFLFVTGLAGTARDIAALTHDGAHIYTMAGAMGGACMIGLGLALARPDKRVLVATGSGIKRTRTVASEADLAEGGRLLREGNGTAFVVLRVKPDDPPSYKRNMEPASCRVRFRGALLGAG